MRTDELVTLLATGDVAVDRAIAQRRLAIAVAAGLAGAGALLRIAVDTLVLVTVLFSLLRAVPVLWDGRRYVQSVPAEQISPP